MKRSRGIIYLVVLLVSLIWCGRSTTALAVEDGNLSEARLERLERRVNEMADRQEQLMRRPGGQREQQAQMGMPGREMRGPQLTPSRTPLPGVEHPVAAKLAKSLHDTLGLLFLIGILCNILLSIWIFTDIRKRGEGSGIFIALALVAGIPAAIIYALTRIGDRKG